MSDEARPWRWRNCREIEIGVVFFVLPWQWRIRRESDSDHTQRRFAMQFGPIGLTILADIGNISDETWRAHFGLSESEAWERSGP